MNAFRKYYWYLTAYLRKHGTTMLISIAVAIVIFSVLIPRFVRYLDRKERLYIGIVGEYSLNSLPEEVTSLISAGLTSIEPNGTTTPSVAERWLVEDDGTTYRFVIKKDLKWQDDTTLTSEDLSYNFKDVEVITTPNEIVFKLPEPFAPFPAVVAEPILKYENVQQSLIQNRRMPIGINSFQVTNYQEKNGSLEQITIENPSEQRIYRFYQTEDQAVDAFKHGNVDILRDLTTKHDIFEWNTVELEETIRNDRYKAVFFNNENPVFPRNIRQALSYALPKATGDLRAISPINPESWVYLESSKDYAFDEERAFERILSELPPVKIEFELVTTPNFQQDAEEIKRVWESFGERAVAACQSDDEIENQDFCENLAIDISIRVSNFPDTRNFEAMLVGQEIPSDPDQYSLWHSEQSTNFVRYKNTRIDALLERGRTTGDAEERKAIYQEFQQFFLEDAPVLFLEHLISYEVRRK